MVQQTGARLSKYKRLEQSSDFNTRANFGFKLFKYGPEKGLVQKNGEGVGSDTRRRVRLRVPEKGSVEKTGEDMCSEDRRKVPGIFEKSKQISKPRRKKLFH